MNVLCDCSKAVWSGKGEEKKTLVKRLKKEKQRISWIRIKNYTKAFERFDWINTFFLPSRQTRRILQTFFILCVTFFDHKFFFFFPPDENRKEFQNEEKKRLYIKSSQKFLLFPHINVSNLYANVPFLICLFCSFT